MDKRVDQITLEAARRGDRSAQTALLRQLQDVWFRMCLSLLGKPDEAQDAVQETALRFLRDLPRFRGDSSISTWSLGIAINVTREMRRKARPMQLVGDEQLAAVQSTADSPDDNASDSERQSLLRSMLQHLTDRQREALTLRFFEEFSVEETAQAMQCAEGTVKATVHQALRILKNKLKQLT